MEGAVGGGVCRDIQTAQPEPNGPVLVPLVRLSLLTGLLIYQIYTSVSLPPAVLVGSCHESRTR